MVILSKKKFLLVVFISLVSICFCKPTLAESREKGLTLSPTRNELKIIPGSSVVGSLTVKNSTDLTAKVHFSAEEFNVINQQYDYSFMQESDVTGWILYDKNSIDLMAGESAEVIYRINVPLLAEPGGRYISLFASADTKPLNGVINSRKRVASLLYIDVDGDTTRIGHVVSFNSPWLVFGASKWSAVVRNSGTTHFRSRYNVVFKGLINNKIIFERSGESLILPGTVRAISDDILPPRSSGIYKITHTIGLGDTPAISKNRYVLVVSPTGLLVFILLVILLGILLLRRRKKNN